MNLTKNTKVIIYIFLGAILLFIFLLIVGLNINKQNIAPDLPKEIDKTKPYSDYTSINLLKPGKSTVQDVINLVGKPTSISEAGNKKFLSYETPFQHFTNVVVVDGQTVEYAIENVFSTYRGNLDDYREKYGREDAIYYEKLDEGVWYIFLEDGVGVKVLGIIRQVLYFKPQDEKLFFRNFEEVLEIKREKSQEVEEPLDTIPELE